MSKRFGLFNKNSKVPPSSTKCTLCNGKGWVPRPGCGPIADTTPGGAFREMCRYCKGTGYLASPALRR